MFTGETDREQMLVWCPLIPPEVIQSLLHHKDDLSKINDAYDDWRASMRGKEFSSAKPGIYLDRIRMLMINVGISCARNRELAESVQSIVAETLRERALDVITKLPSKPPEKKAVKETLTAFFKNLKFTRDIYPLEEIQKWLSLSKRKRDLSMKKRAIEESLFQCASVLKGLYIRLLSPDPWGTE